MKSVALQHLSCFKMSLICFYRIISVISTNNSIEKKKKKNENVKFLYEVDEDSKIYSMQKGNFRENYFTFERYEKRNEKIQWTALPIWIAFHSWMNGALSQFQYFLFSHFVYRKVIITIMRYMLDYLIFRYKSWAFDHILCSLSLSLQFTNKIWKFRQFTWLNLKCSDTIQMNIFKTRRKRRGRIHEISIYNGVYFCSVRCPLTKTHRTHCSQYAPRITA